MNNRNTRSLLLIAVMLVALVAGGAMVATAAADDGPAVGTDTTANETTIDTEFIGTVVDEGTVTVEASGVTDNGSLVDRGLTVTVGGQPVTTATAENGSLTAEIDPSVLDLELIPNATVGLAGFDVEDPATVEVVHEAFEVGEGFDLRSVPQGAELSAEGIGAVNVWNATAGTYDTVTDPDFETAADLHQGLYVAGSSDDARVGYTFNTTASDSGTVELSSGWNFASSNFNISATDNLTVEEDLNLVQGDVADLDVFTGDFSQQLGPNDTVEAYDGYWVFVDEGDQPVVRDLTGPAYDRGAREDVLQTAEGELSFGDQATASSTFTREAPTAPGVVVDSVEANTDSAVVVTYEDGGDLVIAGLDTFSASALDGGSVTIPVADTGGFPGEHTAHIIPTAELSEAYAPGDTVSIETADAILDNEAATVFQGVVDFANQSFEDSTTELTATTAGLVGDPDTLFAINLHETTAEGAPGAFVGASPVLNGSNEDVPIPLLDTEGNQLTFNTTDEYIAMIHVVDDENVSEGDLLPPATFPVLRHASADGVVPGGVTDGGEAAAFSAEGAELAFGSQALGVDEQGNAVVYVDNITEAEQVEQTDVSNPAEDLVVLYEGETLTQDSLVDFRNVGDAQNGELLLDVENATPGEHTVELFADARSEFDPTASDVDHPFLTDTRTESTGDERRYILLLEEDLSTDVTADRRTIVQQLQSQATQAQQPVVERLDALPVTVDSQFWIVNALSVTVDSDDVSVADLERVAGVEHVVENAELRLPRPAGDSTELSRDDVRAQQTYGLQQIDVPNFEDTFGLQGEGTTVSIIDNGIGTTNRSEVHPDINISLAASVVGGQIIEGELGPAGNHGLHTAGTATGAANPAGNVPRYSVAPAAELIKINSFAGGGSFLGDSLAGIQYSVAQGADVASLSLGLPPSATNGLSNIQLATEEATQNANDAGMSVVGAIGNEGSGPVGGPGGSPGPEFSTLGIGASTPDGEIAGFSSGDVITPNTVFPITENGALGAYPDTYPRSYVKPDVSAPGAQVLSAGPLGQVVAENPTYSLSQGTSMATPHVSGAIALIQSATDVEHDPKTIERALAETAEKPPDAPAGTNERDIRYGTGIINVTAATLAIQDTTNISGTVTDSATGDALTGVKIQTDTGVVTSTDENGNYSIELTSNVSSVAVTADEFGYTPASQTVPVGSGDQTADFALEPELDVVPVAGQPGFTEFESNFTIVLDVQNLEEYGVELTDAQGVTPADVDVTVAGTTISPGENISFAQPVSANGVPVTVEVDGTFSEGDQFALAHTFGGPGADVDVTTGPTTLTETIGPAEFELSGFSAPSEQPDPAQPVTYVPEVTVTNVGQTPGAAEVRWFAGPLGLQGDNPVEQLAPGESATVSLNFGPLNFASILGGPVEFLHGFDAVPQGAGAGDLTFERFTVGDGLVPLLNPIDPDQPRGAAETSEVLAADVTIENQTFEDSTDEVTVSTSSVLPDDEEYVIVVHNNTEGLPILGSSEVLNGSQEDVTVSLDSTLETTTDLVAMLHFEQDGTFGPPITAFDPEAGAPTPVTDTAEAGIFSAEGAELDFGSQALGVDAQGNAVVYVDNLTEAEQVEQTDVSNPAEDLVVLYEGETLTADSLVDFRNVGDAQNGELLLRANNATPGTHTVELYADSRFSIDPTAQDIDVDHPLIEKTAAESDDTGGSDGYLVVLEEDLQAPAGVDRASAAQRLQQQADLTQAPVVDSLERLDGATVEQQYWITNALLVSTDGVSKTALERLDGVEYVVENIEAEHPRPAPTTGDAGEVRSTANHNVTYGLDAIDVPGFEETYNTQGEGTRVAIIDDGLNVSHPDIDVKLGVQVADGQVINESPTITPGSQHGAHVAGTAVGTADPAGDVPRYSVAPGADLLKADIWVGGPTLGDTITAVQWSVGENADVTSMSLGFGQGLGESTVVPLMADTIQNAEDAGTLVIGSAGNEGSGAAGGPVTSPGAEFNGLSVGASAEGGAIAAFSSGTTVTPNDVLLFPAGASYPDYFPREYLKPDVTAPGVGVLSTGPLGTLVAEDPAYSLSSGTSMAAPHAAGAAALVQAATTEQLDPTTIESALAESAEKPTTEFGGQNERDIRYGTGIINVTAATMAAQNTTTISGTITDSATGDALAGVQVTTDTGVTTATGANGTYSLTVTNDTDSTVVSVEAFGYTDETETVSLGSDQTVDFALDPEVAVTPVAGQPAFAEFQDSFTIVLDVRNVEEYAVELADAQGVSPDEISLTVAGTTISPGENVSLGSVSADDVPVTVEVDGTFSEGDQFALAHTFSGPGADVDVTTGPTTLTETIGPAEFELSGFSAPSEQPDPAQPVAYAVSVTVTNVGQTPGAAEVRWFAGPLGLQGDNPVEELAPGESTTVSLNFGQINFANFLGQAEFLHGFDAVPQGAGVGDLTFERFTVGDGLVPLLNPIDPNQPRGAAETSEVLAADVTIENQTFEDSTDEVIVSTSSVLPDDEEYVIVVHNNTEGLPILGSSDVLNGTQNNVTVPIDTLDTTTDVVAMLHFADNGTFGAPITAFDPAAGAPTPVTDTATVEIQQAEGGNVEFQSQVLGTSDGSPAVLAENVEPVDRVTVDNAFDPQDDFLVLTNGTSVTGSDDVLDFVQLSELNESADVALNATGATPGQHTVVLHEPNDAGTAPDPDAPRTDASTGEVINATATVFGGSVNITDQQFEDNTSQVTVDASDLQPAGASEYKIVVHNQTGVPAGGVGPPIGFSANLTGAETNVSIQLIETLNTTTDVLTMLHFPGDPTGPPIPTLNGTAFGIGDDQAGTVTDTATVEIQQAQGGNVEFQSQVLGTNNGSAAVLAENVTSVDVVTVDNAFDPQDDFLVLTNGTSVTGPDNVIDAVQLSEFGDGSDVALNATGATPGQHTVVLHEPNDAGTGPDPDAPRTDASTGEVINATATVFDGSVNITDQQFEDNTSQVTVDASDLQPAGASEYKIVVHNQTGIAPGGVGPPIGFSANLTGAETNVSIQLIETLNTTTDVLTMLHFPGDPTGPPIPTLNGTDFGIGDDQAGTVTDTATVEIQQAQGGNVEFQSQVLGTNNGSAAVLAENVTSVDVVTVDNAFDPQDDFLVLTNGTSVTGPDNVIDAVQLSELNESADVALNATGATPGQHTVVLHEPNDAGTGPDPSAPRTDASTGEVINATATVFDGSVNITDQQFEDNTSQVTVDASDLQPANASEYKIVVHNQTGIAPGGVGPPIGFSANLTGAETNVTVPLRETLNTTTDVLTMLHFPGDPTGPPIPTLNGTDFGIGDDQAGTVTDTATVEIQQAQGGNVEFQSQVLGTNNGSAAVLAENVTAVDVVTVNDAFNPQEDFLVLTNGTSVTGPDNVIDAVQLSELNESADVTLNATGATPGQHTVVLHEPNDAGTGPDPDAPRTDASTGEVINATATVFDGSVNITNQQFEGSTSEITVNTSNLQPANASEYKIVVHNQTGVPAGGVGPPIGFSANLTGAETNVSIQLTETLNRTTDVLTMLHFPGDPTGPPIPTLNGTAFGIGDDQAGTVTDTATVDVQRFLVSDLTPTDTTVEENEPFDVSATVENIGVFDDSPTVELRLEPNGTEIRNQTLTLAGGSSKKVTFENVTVNEPGEYNHTVAVGGDRVSGDLNVTDLPPGNFSVDFVDQTNETIAGEQQSFNVTVENVGGERAVQAVELDWGNGSYNASEFVTLNPGESTVATLTVQTDDDEFLGQYNVTASSRNDTDTTGARINPERIIEADQAAAGATVNVTVTGRLAAPQNASLVEKYDPAVNDSSARQPARTYNDTAFGPVPFDQQFNGNRSLLVVSAENIRETGETGPGTLELRYEIELPSDATAGAEFGYDAAKSLLELESDAFDIGGDDTVTVSSGSGT